MTERRFHADVRAWLDEVLEHQPVTATYLGDHRHDARLGEHTRVALNADRQRVGKWLDKFQDCESGDWTPDGRIDLTIVIQILKRSIREHDRLRVAFRNPGAVSGECLSGVYLLILREFAPLQERMEGILGRLREAPRVLEEGKALLIPAETPRVWAEVAIESARRGIGLFTGLVPALAEATPAMKEDVVAAARSAAAALNAYADWVEQEVLPRARGEFAVGRELFDEILREDHMVAYDADELLATGWRLIEETERQMKVVASQIAPGRTVAELLEANKRNHPTADGLLDAYRRAMAEARQFVIGHGIASIPEGEAIRVEPTPAFQRVIIPYAAYYPPGFLEAMQEGVFIVTPAGEDAGPEEAAKKLRGHPWAEIPVTALHEAYPGHHLQFVVANRIESLPRKLGGFLSSLFIEGWAFYCEELMEQLGFIDQPIQKLSRLQAQLWRATRIVLDASLHTRGMSVEEGIDFLVRRAGLEPGDARAEVRRYTISPGQPQSYLMGKLQILDIVAEYRRRHPEADMRRMHDDILSCGPLPPRLMRQRLFMRHDDPG